MTPVRQSALEAAVPAGPRGSAWHERLLGHFTTIYPGEGRCALYFFAHAFLLLVCYYMLKTLREPLLLVEASPEVKSYAYAAIALVLLIGVPLYCALCRRITRARISRWVTLFFVANLAVFFLLGRAGADIGFAYYVWVGVFSVTIIAQFWAHAADSFSVQSGQRLFPAIMVAAGVGALVGPSLVGALFAALGPWPLMLVAIALLAATLPLIGLARDAVPESARNPGGPAADGTRPIAGSPSSSSGMSGPGAGGAPAGGGCLGRCLGGFALVFRDRYLLLLAALIVLLNCVNTTGEYLLTELVVGFASAQVARDPTLDTGTLIAGFYSSYYLTINVLTLLAQLFLVARLFRRIGVHGALLILPLIALVGYGLAVFVPVFGVLRLVKTLENSADYSIMNTSRQALYLPLPVEQKYQGKIAIDTFFYRFGDLLQAGLIFAGLHWLGFSFRHFAVLNACLAVVWFAVAWQLARHHAERTQAHSWPGAWRLSPGACRAWLAGCSGRAFAPLRRAAAALLAACLGVLALTASAPAEAGADSARSVAHRTATTGLFDTHAVLPMAMHVDLDGFCRNPHRRRCSDAPALISYHDATGREQRIEATIRSRGRYSKETAACRFPALFVFFRNGTEGTLFDGETMLPLTTHCQPFNPDYEQYVLKEFLAYRIYNLLTAKSLAVRLVRMTYHDTSGKREPLTRLAFFTEHFDSLAARNNGTVLQSERWDPREGDATELAVHDVFQYLIGNTDWSVIYGHNIVHIEDADGRVMPVPYDFDFSGLVDADYAGPPPRLPIRDVRQRLFRGFCREDTDWAAVSARMQAAQPSIAVLIESLLAGHEDVQSDVSSFLAGALSLVASPPRLREEIRQACRRR